MRKSKDLLKVIKESFVHNLRIEILIKEDENVQNEIKILSTVEVEDLNIEIV